jgi:N-acetylmuramoyl-L-alanine amidase
MVDEAGEPVAGEAVKLKLPSGERVSEVRSRLDRKGRFKLEGLKNTGNCTITFPDLDLAAWQRWTGSPPPPTPATRTLPQDTPDGGPVAPADPPPRGGKYVKAGRGDCISSLALRTGHFWDTLWNHNANAELKRRRGDPNVLMAGDAVFIPDKRPREETGAIDQQHKFLRRGEPSVLRLTVQDNGRPVANAPYELSIDGASRSGTTGAQGEIVENITGRAQRAELVVTATSGKVYRFVLSLGAVDPVTTRRGVCQRLRNLGYNCREHAGDQELEMAVRAFQRDNSLPDNGIVDDATRTKLKEKHGS